MDEVFIIDDECACAIQSNGGCVSCLNGDIVDVGTPSAAHLMPSGVQVEVTNRVGVRGVVVIARRNPQLGRQMIAKGSAEYRGQPVSRIVIARNLPIFILHPTIKLGRRDRCSLRQTVSEKNGRKAHGSIIMIPLYV